MAVDKPSTKGQAWFCTIGLPSDILVEVDDMTFHLHKFPLISKSKKLHDLITEQEINNNSTSTSKLQSQKGKAEERGESQPEDGDEVKEEKEKDGENSHIESETEEDDETCHISLPNFPGGSETFETAAKSCYGVKIDLTPSNVAPLRCAGQFLEMTEEYAEDNLITKTESYLSRSVFRNIKDSIKVLKSCESVMPLAEDLGIVQRCIDAFSSKAALVDPSLFGWSVTMTDGTSAMMQQLVEGESRKKSSSTPRKGKAKEPWFEELGSLSPDLLKRLISAMRERELNADVIENCVIHYAKKHFPGITRTNRKSPLPSPSTSASSETKQRELLETIVTNLPPDKSSHKSSTTTRFLFGLLRTANILNASEGCKSALERKIGMRLEEAMLDDLLIPSYSYLNDTLYDVECVERILGHFLNSYEQRTSSVGMVEGVEGENGGGNNPMSPTIMLVGKLIDGYLSEIASDANFKSDKFFELALLLPEQARLFHDGLYRAVDVYLKAHPWISEEERDKICGVMDCQKLTLEACTHAAQNERLPLRALVQVLFFEQLQLRHAITGTLLAANGGAPIDSTRQSVQGDGNQALEFNSIPTTPTRLAATPPRTPPAPHNNNRRWREAKKENEDLKLNMNSMRTRVYELERECSTMKKAIEKIDKVGEGGGGDCTGGRRWRSSVTRKFGCKFKTQVCDSHESTVAESRRGRHHHNHVNHHHRS